MKNVFVLLLIMLAMLFNGCSAMWGSLSIGKMYGKAEEEGFNYEDTGVVADPYFLYVNRKSIRESAIYPNEACRDGRQEKLLIGNGE